MGHVLRANANAPWQVGGKDFADKSETKNEPVAPFCQSECSRAAVLVMIFGEECDLHGAQILACGHYIPPPLEP